MEKTFLLGVGAQKSGTTWVYRYLQGHPECALGRIKEMASLATLFDETGPLDRQKAKLETLQKVSAKMALRMRLDKVTDESLTELSDKIQHVAADYDWSSYLQYYAGQFEQKPASKLTADLTPECGLMSEQALARAKNELEKAGYRVKVLFLMREPVERCYSALRMAYRRGLKAGRPMLEMPDVNFATDAIQPWVYERTRYEKILPKIESVFAPQDRYIAFFETFFNAQSVQNLCEFLGIAFVPINFGKRVNTSPRIVEPSAVEWSQVQTFYQETYKYCAAKFGADLISDLWGYDAKSMSS